MRRYSLPPATAPRIYLGRIPRGYAGTVRTAEQVSRLIREGAKDFYVRQRAIDILLARGVRPKNYLGEIEALFEWVQRNVRYTKDPFRVEVLHSPRRMLELRAGDCDDMTILLGAMLESIGHPVRLILTGPDPLRPRLFSHIYLEVSHRGRWIPCDATMAHPVGWAPRALVKQVISIQEEPSHDTRRNAAARPGRVGAGVAPGTHPRDRARGHSVERSPGEAALGSAPDPRSAPAEPVAQAPAALHLGQGTRSATAAQHYPADQGATATLGHPAPDSWSASHTGSEHSCGREEGAAATTGSASDGAASRTSAVGGSGRAEAISPVPRTDAAALNGYLMLGAGLYSRFNRFDPACVTQVTHCRLMPPLVVQLGRLVGLIYRSDKWQRGQPRTYIHVMENPPRLVTDVGGRQLFLVGGSYRVTPAGIEG